MNAKSIIGALSAIAIVVAIFLLLVQQKPTKEESAFELKTVHQKASYAVGHQFATRLHQTNSDFDGKAIAKAVQDVFSGAEIKMTREQMREAMGQYRDAKLKEREDAGKTAKEEGEKFLAENKTKEGIKSTDSGLQYQVLKEGEGAKPGLDDTVTVHYKGTFINGETFDSSYDRGEPAKFRLRGVIEGWKEALQLMNEGSKYKIFVPSNLAYGERGAGVKIPPNSALVFEVELQKVESAQANAAGHGHGAATDTPEASSEEQKKTQESAKTADKKSEKSN